MFLYKTILYKDISNVSDPPPTNETDKADFVDNHKEDAILVEDILISETTFVVEVSYADFEELLVEPIDWTDVKYIENSKFYELNLLLE